MMGCCGIYVQPVVTIARVVWLHDSPAASAAAYLWVVADASMCLCAGLGCVRLTFGWSAFGQTVVCCEALCEAVLCEVYCVQTLNSARRVDYRMCGSNGVFAVGCCNGLLRTAEQQ